MRPGPAHQHTSAFRDDSAESWHSGLSLGSKAPQQYLGQSLHDSRGAQPTWIGSHAQPARNSLDISRGSASSVASDSGSPAVHGLSHGTASVLQSHHQPSQQQLAGYPHYQVAAGQGAVPYTTSTLAAARAAVLPAGRLEQDQQQLLAAAAGQGVQAQLAQSFMGTPVGVAGPGSLGRASIDSVPSALSGTSQEPGSSRASMDAGGQPAVGFGAHIGGLPQFYAGLAAPQPATVAVSGILLPSGAPQQLQAGLAGVPASLGQQGLAGSTLGPSGAALSGLGMAPVAVNGGLVGAQQPVAAAGGLASQLAGVSLGLQQQGQGGFGSPMAMLPGTASLASSGQQPSGLSGMAASGLGLVGQPAVGPGLSVGSPPSLTSSGRVLGKQSSFMGSAPLSSTSNSSLGVSGVNVGQLGSLPPGVPGTSVVGMAAGMPLSSPLGSASFNNFSSGSISLQPLTQQQQQLSPGVSVLSALSGLSGLSAHSAPPQQAQPLSAALPQSGLPGLLSSTNSAGAALLQEATAVATAVAAQQSATAKQAAATYTAASNEAQRAQQAASLLNATAQQAAVNRRPDLAQEAATQALHAEQKAAALSAVAQEAASVYMDASQKAADAHQQMAAARAEGSTTATTLAGSATTLAGSATTADSGGSQLASPASAAGPSAAAAASPPGAPVPLQHSLSQVQDVLLQQLPHAQMSGMSVEQAQQQLALLQQYLAQQAQQAAAGQNLYSPPVLTPQPSALSYVSSLDGSGGSFGQLPMPAGAGTSAGTAGTPALLSPTVGISPPQQASAAGAPGLLPTASGINAQLQQLQQQQQQLQQQRLGPTSPTSAGAQQQAMPNLVHSYQRTPQMVKVVCSSGGSFIKLSTGTWEYEGGETRLVGLPLGGSYQTLLDALERITAPLSESSGRSALVPPQVKYRLPSDPTVWVDVVDDEDVQLMFDEWVEFCNSQHTSAKLHVFVQWGGEGQEEESGPTSSLGASRLSQEEGGTPRAGAGAEEEGGGSRRRHHDPDSDDDETPSSSDSDDLDTPQSARNAVGSPQGKRRNRQQDKVARLRPSIDLAAIVEKMEIIDAVDITLVRFLGSGGYGDVYLAKWHNCEVAVKCLNPSLFFNGGDLSSVNRAAIVDLVKEADMLGSLRHPNIVWVYGIVLPNLEDRKGWKKRNKDLAELIAASPGSTLPAVPGLLRPPALVAEYMGGGSLKSALGRKADIVAGALTRVVLALDAAKGMEYLHAKQIVHFDLKSGNLLLGYRDRRPVCKVADFGLSKQKYETFVSGVTSQRGTLPWTAPEIIRTPDKVTEKVDIFSFGIVMWELWAGKEPYEGLNYHALLLQLSNPDVKLRPPIPDGPEWEGEPLPELAPGWRGLMEKCWAEDPDDRPSFADIIKDLRSMVSALKPVRSGSKNMPRSPSH